MTEIFVALGEPEVLAQLAEEAAELAQAALKLRRVLDGRNPTPVTGQEARRNLMEEYTDVVHCAMELGLRESPYLIAEKHDRWRRRLGVEDDGWCGPMTEVDARIIVARADCNMNANEVARREYMHRNTVIYHLDKTKRDTGLDGRCFYDLIELLKIAKEVLEGG